MTGSISSAKLRRIIAPEQMLSRRSRLPIVLKRSFIGATSFSIMENDAECVSPSRDHLAHAMTHVHPISASCAPNWAMVDGKNDGIALA
jgi:hypothetical protein